MRRLVIALVVLGAALGCANERPPATRPTATLTSAPQGDFAFTHFNVLAPSGGVAADQTVIVRGDRIVFVGKSSDVSLSADLAREDGGGRRFLTPGLADMHAHLPYEPEHWLPLYLTHGVTTVLSLQGTPEHLTLRDRVRRGEVVGPTIYTSGEFVNEPDVKTPADAERAVIEQKKAGYDVIKIHGNLQLETFRRLVAVAAEQKIGVTGHVPRNLRFDSVFDVGMKSVAHAEEMLYTQFSADGKADPSSIGPFAARAGAYGLWLTPTLINYEDLAAQWGNPAVAEEKLRKSEWTPYLHPELRALWTIGNFYVRRTSDPAVMKRNAEFLKVLVRRLYEAGVHFTLGTDAPLPLLVPGESLHQEIDALREAGVPLDGVLVAGTKNAGEYAAKFLGETQPFGVVVANARADLLVVDDDPLKSPAALRRPRGVMVRGRWYPRAELDRQLEALRQRYAAMPEIRERPIDVAEAKSYVGTYAAKGEPFSVRVELTGSELTATATGLPTPWKLVRTGPREFRTLGIPMRLVFGSDGTLQFFEPGSPPVTLERAH